MQAEPRARVNLQQLVYGSLAPIIEANTRMSQSMVDTIMKFSDDMGHDDDGYPVVQLKTLQLVYDQIRHDDLDMLYSEKIGLEIPLLSIIPLSGLKVSKSKIQFSTEVQEVEYNDGQVDIYTKVTAADSERSGQTSRIDFEIEIESDPVVEGLARFLDQLGQNFIPTVHKKSPLDSDGNKLDDEDQQNHETRKSLYRKEAHLVRLLSQLTGIQRQDEDKLKGGEDFGVYESLEPYKSELNKKLAEVRKKILEHDIVYELSQDDESEKQEEEDKDDKHEQKRKPTNK
jgi:phosphoenolpyruvate carboxylase